MRCLKIAAALALLALIPGAAQAQSTLTACYVPKSGTVYRIQAPGSPTKCSQNHVEFSWTSDGAHRRSLREKRAARDRHAFHLSVGFVD